MWCACQSGCCYNTTPYHSYPLRYFKDVYKPARAVQRLWRKGRGNLFTIANRCATALGLSVPSSITYLFLKLTLFPGYLFMKITDHTISRQISLF